MGTVIAWPGPSAKAARRGLEPNEPRGQILFFTGVRYERREEAGGPGADPSTRTGGAQRGRRKRA